ncbi:MAG: hypothetical protein AB7I33_14490 [Gemmatimonadales bacterium]
MPNGHGGIPRFGSPAVLLLLLGLVLAGGPVPGLPQGRWPAYVLAVLLGWRLAFHIHMWDVTGYGGALAPPQRLAAARRRFIVGSLVYVLAAAGLVRLWFDG